MVHATMRRYRQENSAVIEVGTTVVGIVVCAAWANQPVVGVAVRLVYTYVS
jgi:hypothetical protein